VLTVPANSLVQVPLRLFHAMPAPLVIAIERLGWHRTAEHKARGQDGRQYL
jgi:hypothetical protein